MTVILRHSSSSSLHSDERKIDQTEVKDLEDLFCNPFVLQVEWSAYGSASDECCVSKGFSEGTLVVFQREWAVCSPQSFDVIGSKDATTCHIVGLRDPSTGYTALAHLDHPSTAVACLEAMVNRLLMLMEREATDQEASHAEVEGTSSLDLYMVGGFEEELSQEMSHTVVGFFRDHTRVFSLRLAYISDINSTVLDGTEGVCAPIHRSLAIRTSDGSAFPVVFDRKTPIPVHDLRAARIWGEGSDMMEVYDEVNGHLCVDPFEYRVQDYFQLMLSLPDHILLQYTSTSPLVEGPYFVEDLKRTIKFMIDHPSSQSFFIDSKPFLVNRWEQR